MPLDILGLPGYESLSQPEKDLCSSIRQAQDQSNFTNIYDTSTCFYFCSWLKIRMYVSLIMFCEILAKFLLFCIIFLRLTLRYRYLKL